MPDLIFQQKLPDIKYFFSANCDEARKLATTNEQKEQATEVSRCSPYTVNQLEYLMPLESYNPGLSALVSYLILTYLMPLESLVCTVCEFAETVECELQSPFTSDSLIGANCWSELFQH